MRKIIVSSSLGVLIISLLSFGLLKNSQQTVAQITGNTNPCTVATTSLTSGMVLSPLQPVSVYIPTTTATPTVARVTIIVDGQPIGIAKQTSTNSWNMPWVTNLMASGTHLISARISDGGALTCDTGAISVIIPPLTSSAPTLAIDVLPVTWTGPTNTSIPINSNVIVTGTPTSPFVIKDYALFDWTTTIGSVQPSRDSALFSSGPTGGTGKVTVRAMYGGKQIIRDIPISVASQTTTTTTTNNTTSSTTTGTSSSPSTSTGTTSTTSTQDTTTAPLTREQLIQQATVQLQSQPQVLSCATTALTQSKIDELAQASSRLSPVEFKRIKDCFTATNFKIPAVYSPVIPDKTTIGQLESVATTRINDAKTKETNQDTTKKSSLLLQGQAEPNSDILLYVFSEPLVLYTKSDADGNWTYELSDPLAPGKHEAYAVVEAATGTYKKSNPFSFIIQTAQATAENPNGYSLSVESVASLNPPQSKTRINLYIVASLILVLMVLGIGTFVLVTTNKHIPSDDQTETKDEQSDK